MKCYLIFIGVSLIGTAPLFSNAVRNKGHTNVQNLNVLFVIDNLKDYRNFMHRYIEVYIQNIYKRAKAVSLSINAHYRGTILEPSIASTMTGLYTSTTIN